MKSGKTRKIERQREKKRIETALQCFRKIQLVVYYQCCVLIG